MTLSEIQKKLEELAASIMQARTERLAKHRIWLKGWLRFHKIKRELRKVRKVKDLL